MSRTFPLATCTASGTHSLPVGDEIAEAGEDDVSVGREDAEIEDVVQVDARPDLRVCAHELAKVQALVPGAHGMPLDEPICGVALEPGPDEREENPLAEEE